MDLDKIREKLRLLLDRERFLHSISVEKTAKQLAKIYGADEDRAAQAALLHDCAKYMSGKELLLKAKKHGLKFHASFERQPHLLHGPVSAFIARERFGIRDKGVLAAIKNHTSGRPGMSRLEEIIYLADHIEPGRSFKNAAKIRKSAKNNINKTIALVAREMLKYLLTKDREIYPATLTTRNYYLKKSGAGKEK
ncbi:MAG: bis(5'-nucleosyl)-tetraphosphatase (symmetrical) YqeK [Candidatus Margulisiibacteriota bacterium]